MKKILTSVLLLVGVSMFAQTATTTVQTSTTTLTPKAKAVCNTWYLSQTEVFSDIHKPNDQQKGDLVIFMENGRYRWIYNGVAEGGTWTMDKAGVYITMTNDAGSMKKFKVLETTATSIRLDYQDADLIHNILYFATTQATSTAR